MTTTRFEIGALESSLAAVLETMFYCPLEETTTENRAVPEASRTATLNFKGPVSGRFQLRCSREAAALLAENFHGEEADEASAEAVITELANMVCGNFLSRTDSQAIFHLSSPKLDQWSQMTMSVCATLERGHVWVSIEADPPFSA